MADLENSNQSVEKKTNTEKPAKAKKPSVFARMKKWGRELKSEIKKIVWPTRHQTTKNTAVVLVTIAIVGVFIWILDTIFGAGVATLIKYLA